MWSARPGFELALFLEDVGERLALEELHREIQRAVGQPTDVIRRDAVRMIDFADGECLALEPTLHVGRSGERRMQDLDGDLPAQTDVRRAKHEAHAAATQASSRGDIARRRPCRTARYRRSPPVSA